MYISPFLGVPGEPVPLCLVVYQNIYVLCDLYLLHMQILL